MSRFMENPSARYKKAVSALRLLLSEEGEAMASRAFAEVTEEARRNEFLKVHELESPSNDHVCYHRLMGEPCPDEQCYSPGLIPHADHCSEWEQDGKTKMIISQPYYLTYSQIKETVKFCEEHGLEAMIDARSSWHFPSTTISVQYHRVSETSE
jgi:hypothetical protein